MSPELAPAPLSFSVAYFVGNGIALIGGLGALLCLIMVLIPLFKEKGPGLGILGVFCGIFAYVWGWMNAKKHNLKKWMIIWTICILVTTIGYSIALGSVLKTAAANPDVFSPALEVPVQEAPSEL